MQKVYSVYDKKALFYGNLMTLRSDIDFERSIVQALSSGNSTLSDFPEDFSGFCFGEFDDHKGTFTLYDAPMFMFDLDTIRDKYLHPQA